MNRLKLRKVLFELDSIEMSDSVELTLDYIKKVVLDDDFFNNLIDMKNNTNTQEDFYNDIIKSFKILINKYKTKNSDNEDELLQFRKIYLYEINENEHIIEMLTDRNVFYITLNLLENNDENLTKLENDKLSNYKIHLLSLSNTKTDFYELNYFERLEKYISILDKNTKANLKKIRARHKRVNKEIFENYFEVY